MKKSYLPHSVTLLNLFLGCLAVVSLLFGQYLQACWLVGAAAVADFLDGLVARALGVSSPLGKELDSLADVISFGLVPGLIFYVLLCEGRGVSLPQNQLYGPAVPAFLVTAFSALRLGKFNLDERQQEGFIGLPTPANTLFAVGLLLLFLTDRYGLQAIVLLPALLYGLIGLSSYLLVAELPMFSLKFKNLAWKGNEIRFIFAGAVIALLLILREGAPAAIIVLYIGLSLVQNARSNT